jgi:uncharacterized protein (DUF2147 family)
MRAVWTAVVAATLISSGGVSAGPDPLVGTWMTEERDSKVRVAPCGKAYCATIVWAKKALTDDKNPDPSLRNRGIVGVQLTRNMVPDGAGTWTGSIYNPEDGKTYSASMTLKGPNGLQVSGCVLGGLICGSDTWTRQSEDTASATGATLTR